MQSHRPWQSWSGTHKSFLPWPSWDYCPLPNPSPLKPVQKASEKAALYRQPKPTGYWCSWYAFGKAISASKITQQAKLARRLNLPIDTIIIDDGWTAWGDWQQADQQKFPGGIAPLANQVKTLGYKPGLWLAPFLVSPTSQLLQSHPEFLVRDHRQHFVNGFRSFPPFDHWFYRKYLLDFRQQAVQKHIFKSLDQMIENWGINVLKLDFLYAPYFNPHFTTATAASHQVRQLLHYLRHKHPQVFVIACGCSFTDARGLVDAIRMSKDSTAPPPLPSWFRKQLYKQRMRLLEKKSVHSQLWQGLYPDPDVQMFAFDTKQTRKILSKLDPSFIRGYGDDLRVVQSCLQQKQRN